MAEEDENDDTVEETSSGGGKKLLIIGLLGGLLHGGGAAAGFFIMQSGNEDQVVEVVEEKAPELPDFQYARMDKLNLPLFYNGRILNYSVMNVSMETLGTDDKLLVVRNVIIIRDALLRYYSVNSIGREDSPRIVDFNRLSDKIKEVVNAEIGREIVTRVVISENMSF
jgi:flagellar basal body-associated protein FliL